MTKKLYVVTGSEDGILAFNSENYNKAKNLDTIGAMNLRHEIWFSLTITQRRTLSAHGIYANTLMEATLEELCSVTSNKKLISDFLTIKFYYRTKAA